MADLADIADSLIEFETSNVMLAFRNKLKKNTGPKKSKYCKECHELIPLKRRQLGLHFCVSCAEDIEKRKRF